MIAPSLPVDRPGCGESFHSPADGGHQKNTKTYQEIDTGDVEEVRAVKGNSEGRAIAVTSAVLVASVAAACTSIAHSSLDHQPKFTITNTISSSSTTQTPALLYPGVSRYLWYTAHNPLTVPITVTTMSISSVTAPAGCPIVNLSYAATTFTGSLVVPAQGSNSVPVPISLFETHKNQDSCENTTFRSISKERQPSTSFPRRQPFEFIAQSVGGGTVRYLYGHCRFR